MTQLSSKDDDVIITHQNLKIDKFGDFSCDIDYNSSTGVFRDVISLIINQCDSRRPQGASGRHSVCQPRSESKRSAVVYIYFANGSTRTVVTNVRRQKDPHLNQQRY